MELPILQRTQKITLEDVRGIRDAIMTTYGAIQYTALFILLLDNNCS